MYIFKNALKSIWRSRGRNILIAIIALVIAVSACIALSIKESAAKAREDTLSLMNITAQISFDRGSMMQDAMGEGETGEMPEFDRESMKEMLQQNTSLTLEEYQSYAKADSVNDSYYQLSATMNATGELEPIDTMGTFNNSDSDENDAPSNPFGGEMGGGKDGRDFGGMMGAQGDFTVVGYSSDNAMTEFVSGNLKISEGVVFDQNTKENVCIISDELATYNNLEVGSELTLENPNDEEETHTFKIVGIYEGEADSESSFMGGFSTATDSANKIMTSYEALKAICDTSAENAEEVTDENSGLTTTTAISSTLNYTYVLSTAEDFEAFKTEAAELGLSDEYTVSSSDITEYENSLVPLENLSQTATYFLIVVFVIGAIILIVINIFNIRERKYEIGVLTAIGMKKQKVALQFVVEMFVITLAAIIIGAGIGAVGSVPITNALLENQISSNQQSADNMQSGFGRDTQIEGGMMQMPTMPNGGEGGGQQPPSGGFGGFMGNIKDNAASYISEVSYSTNLTVIAQLIGVGIALTLVSSLAAVLFIMRYEPLKILSNRD